MQRRRHKEKHPHPNPVLVRERVAQSVCIHDDGRVLYSVDPAPLMPAACAYGCKTGCKLGICE